MKFLTGLLILLVSVLFPADQINKVGTAGALFLRIPVGGEAIAMGSAYSAVASNAQAAFWNPASLVMQEKKYDSQFIFTPWMAGLNFQAAAFSMKFGNNYAAAVSEILLRSPDMEVTTTNQQNGTGEYFTYQDFCLGLSLAKRFTDKFSVGGTLKYINESTYSITSHGIAFDVGSLYNTGYRDFKLAMFLKNFGPDMQFGGSFYDSSINGNIISEEELEYESYYLPLSITIGVAGTVYHDDRLSCLVSVEGFYPNDYSQRLHFGIKTDFQERFSVLMGYLANYEQESLSIGFSTQVGNIKFEYGYRPIQNFSNISSFSIGYMF